MSAYDSRAVVYKFVHRQIKKNNNKNIKKYHYEVPEKIPVSLPDQQ